MSDTKVSMLNALWFKDGGAEAYAKYGEAAGPIVVALGQSEAYQKIAHLREIGLENSLLIRCDRLP